MSSQCSARGSARGSSALRGLLAVVFALTAVNSAPTLGRHADRCASVEDVLCERAGLNFSSSAPAKYCDMACPGDDEQPLTMGCQIRCAGVYGRRGESCTRAREVCSSRPGCDRVKTNAEGTWATLKQRVRPPDPKSKRPPWCTPSLVESRPQTPCAGRSSPLCAVVSPPIREALFTPKLAEKMIPHAVPVVTAQLGRTYTRSRQAALPTRLRRIATAFLLFVVGRYEAMPQALAFLADEGDEHDPAQCNACAQAFELRELLRPPGPAAGRAAGAAATGANASQPVRRPLSPLGGAAYADTRLRSLQPATDAADAGGPAHYRCTADTRLSGEERALWRRRLSRWLGPPPRRLPPGLGGLQFLVHINSSALLARPRGAYVAILRSLLSRRQGEGRTMALLLDRGLWRAILSSTEWQRGSAAGAPGNATLGGAEGGAEGGGAEAAAAPSDGSCDAVHGVASGAGDADAMRPRPSASLSAAALEWQRAAVAPMGTPSKAERAHGCGRHATACVVVVQASPSLQQKLEAQKARGVVMLSYARKVFPGGPSGEPPLYLVPNVYHEHAVYLRCVGGVWRTDSARLTDQDDTRSTSQVHLRLLQRPPADQRLPARACHVVAQLGKTGGCGPARLARPEAARAGGRHLHILQRRPTREGDDVLSRAAGPCCVGRRELAPRLEPRGRLTEHRLGTEHAGARGPGAARPRGDLLLCERAGTRLVARRGLLMTAGTLQQALSSWSRPTGFGPGRSRSGAGCSPTSWTPASRSTAN